jgi:hypothetical protein
VKVLYADEVAHLVLGRAKRRTSASLKKPNIGAGKSINIVVNIIQPRRIDDGFLEIDVSL